MSHLVLYLFGGFHAELGGQSLAALGTDKNRALLAYLALEPEHPHRRETLAALLWPDHPEAVARNSLRQALYHLRQVLIEGNRTEPYLLITSEQVRFNPASDFWIDVTEFRSRLSACQAHHPASQNLCGDCMDNLQSAIDLYRGDVLAGFTLPLCTQFTEWQVCIQESCHRQVLAALSNLAGYFEASHAYDQLIACTQRKIELEPWRESAYRRQMWALAMNGQREQALLRYETLVKTLKRELGISPIEETTQLYEQIRQNRISGRRVQPKFAGDN